MLIHKIEIILLQDDIVRLENNVSVAQAKYKAAVEKGPPVPKGSVKGMFRTCWLLYEC